MSISTRAHEVIVQDGEVERMTAHMHVYFKLSMSYFRLTYYFISMSLDTLTLSNSHK